MNLTIHLRPDDEKALTAKARAAGLSPEDYARLALERDLAIKNDAAAPLPDQPLRAVSEILLRRVRKLPPEAFEGLRKDGASQHDHYIYGTSKRDDL